MTTRPVLYFSITSSNMSKNNQVGCMCWFGVGTSSPRFTFAKPFNKSTHASNLRVFFGHHDDDDDDVADDNGIEVVIISNVRNSTRAFDAEAISNDISLNLMLNNICEYYWSCVLRCDENNGEECWAFIGYLFGFY